MNRAANVHSIEAIRDFRISYCKLSDEVRRGLDQKTIQIRKFVDWVNTDQRNYWLAEIKTCQKKLAEATGALNRKKLAGSGKHPNPASEERIAVRKAKERLEFAEKKLKAVQHYSRIVEAAVRDYDSQSRQLGSFIQADVTKGVQMLDGVLRSLEGYTSSAPPESE